LFKVTIKCGNDSVPAEHGTTSFATEAKEVFHRGAEGWQQTFSLANTPDFWLKKISFASLEKRAYPEGFTPHRGDLVGRT